MLFRTANNTHKQQYGRHFYHININSELLKAKLQYATTGSNYLPPTYCCQLGTTPATSVSFYVAVITASWMANVEVEIRTKPNLH